MKPTLILFSGLPGCGKTTLAQSVAGQLGLPLFAKDHAQQFLRSQGLAGRSGIEGYRLILDLTDAQLGLGVSAILDGVFPLDGFRNEGREIAVRHQARFRVIHCYCSDEALWKARMSDRVQYVAGWTPVGWEEVERMRGQFQAWKPDEALFVDAVNPPDENLSRVLAYLA